jgi:hypothetical protein
VTYGTYLRRAALKKLLFMASDTRFVTRIICLIGKGVLLGTDSLPVWRWELVTGIALDPVGLGIVRKLRKLL